MRSLRLRSQLILVPLIGSVRSVHTSPFRVRTRTEKNDEAIATARDALLQFNVMIHRGVEPDVLTYTSLIQTMGRARMEWQAYKLFSRMLEGNIRPIPETYVALKNATSPKRSKLIEELEVRIRDSIESLPSTLAKEEAEVQSTMQQQSLARFKEYLKGEIPQLAAAEGIELGELSVDGVPGKEESPANQGQEDKAYQTVHIRHPVDVWTTHKHIEAMWNTGENTALGKSSEDAELRATLEQGLRKMHEEELRIFLTIHRQLRHGSKEELIQRVLDSTGRKSIESMLARRKKYFNAVAEVLKVDLDDLKQQKEQQQQGGTVAEGEKEQQGVEMVETTRTSAIPTPAAGGQAAELSASEAYDAGPSHLIAPWGVLRKPMIDPMKTQASMNHISGSLRSLEKLDRTALSSDEVEMIVRKSMLDELSDVPQSLLRRYAYQHNLRWRRRDGPTNLLSTVAWHAKVFKHGGDLQTASPPSTPSLRLQAAQQDLTKTLDTFEAFRIISQRTKNLQVVDSKEINTQLRKKNVLEKTMTKVTERDQRREKHLLEAEALRQQAKLFRPEDPVDDDETHILGLGDTVRAVPSPNNRPEELPPWVVSREQGGERFNFKTGRFGNPELGRYQELSDGKFKVLPVKESLEQFEADVKFLDRNLRDSVEASRLNETLRDEAIAKEKELKLQRKGYRRFESFVSRAKEKQQRLRQDDETEVVKPLPPPRRMSAILRHGKDRTKVSATDIRNFSKSL